MLAVKNLIKNISKTKLKVLVFQLTIIFLFILFFLFLLFPKNYSKNYNIKDIVVSETYNKKQKSYYFTFKYKDITLDFLLESRYTNHRSLINDIEILEDNDNFCLIPKSSKLNLIPICYQDNTIIHYKEASENLKEQFSSYLKNTSLKDTYNDIEIYNRDYTYLIWNYDGFYYINKDNKQKIDIFDKELYTVNLIDYTKDYLIIADYDSNYTFNRIYTITFKDGKLKKYNFDDSIYFDSYFLGYKDNKTYLVDNKESKIYEINAKNGKVEKAKNQILKNNSWESVNIKTLINKNVKFTYASNYEYTLENNTIYLNYKDKDIKTLISKDVKNIVRIKNKDIFYLKEDDLYHFNPEVGEELLLTFFEWNFNYENIIYVN